jgi:hypothetical protein
MARIICISSIQVTTVDFEIISHRYNFLCNINFYEHIRHECCEAIRILLTDGLSFATTHLYLRHHHHPPPPHHQQQKQRCLAA